jgi:hypothetical protein
MHDIIENCNEKLVYHINRISSSPEATRFAFGYFLLSRLTFQERDACYDAVIELVKQRFEKGKSV